MDNRKRRKAWGLPVFKIRWDDSILTFIYRKCTLNEPTKNFGLRAVVKTVLDCAQNSHLPPIVGVGHKRCSDPVNI